MVNRETEEFAKQWIEEGKPCIYRYELIGKIYMSIRNNMGEEGAAEIISEMLESCLDEYIEPYCELNLTCGLKFTGLTGYVFDF